MSFIYPIYSQATCKFYHMLAMMLISYLHILPLERLFLKYLFKFQSRRSSGRILMWISILYINHPVIFSTAAEFLHISWRRSWINLQHAAQGLCVHEIILIGNCFYNSLHRKFNMRAQNPISHTGEKTENHKYRCWIVSILMNLSSLQHCSVNLSQYQECTSLFTMTFKWHPLALT